MEPGTLVWCDEPKGDSAWILAEVVSRTDDELTVKQTDKRDNVFSRPSEIVDEESGMKKFKGVELANTKLSDEEREEGRDDDLITLPHLHEPAILHAISERFFYGKIYTWTGPVLIAVNPFQRLPLYTNEILEAYRREGLFRSQGMGTPGSELEPHIFAIADRSYRQMMQEQRKSQAILISGESGAGKTESTKIVMLYLTTLGNTGMENNQEDTGELSVMQKVLQSNPVLEAFGNAKTLRNDNSSRFGKFIELGFTRAGHLIGARVETYLLEKVRLAFHASGERNYHIFYQLLRGASEEDKLKYEFNDGDTGGMELPMYYHFTGQGGAPHLREFTDESGLEYTIKAMRNLGWSQETIDSVMSLIAGIIHLGQISFNKKVDDASGLEIAEVGEAKEMELTARLCGVDLEKLNTALTERVIVARGQEIKTQLTVEKAQDARDALAKTIYGALFLWVVEQVNKSIKWENDGDVRSSVGVLDIFGFECFSINSFEQLCINFTNEALQQQFNKFIFKLEQAEYEAESIEWAFISFPDNQDCLDTIQKPKTGILSMLDDECRLPKGSDKNWCKRMCDFYLPNKNQTTSDNTRFVSSKIQQSKAVFCVRHFAGLVEYTAETNFMEKNKDEIPLTAQNMLDTAPNQLVKDIYDVQKKETEGRAPEATGKPGRAPKSKTVGQQFKEQLNNLIEQVSKTDPHYIRCLKPNDAAKPKMLTRKRLTEQLRYGGVLEAVRVARAGYPVRLVHEQFFQRYRMLLPSVSADKLPWNMDGHGSEDLCVKLVDCVIAEGKKTQEATGNAPLDPNESGISRSEKIRRMQTQPAPLLFPKSDVQLGKTKVFMRKPPHDVLEAHRVFQQRASATVMQSWVRGLMKEKRYLDMLHAARLIERFYRGCKGRERWWKLRGEAAGNLLTNNFRMLIVWRRYNRARKGTIKFQAASRGRQTRKMVAAVQAQKIYRGYIARKRFLQYKSAIISLQCAARKNAATKVLNEFKREQKDVGKLKQNNEKLKTEMASLRAMLAAQAKEGESEARNAKEMEAKQTEIENLEKRIAELEKELEEAKKLVDKVESDIKTQAAQFASEKEQLEQRVQYHVSQRASTVMPSHAAPPGSPKPTKRAVEATAEISLPPLAEGEKGVTVNPEVLAQHRAHVQKLEETLEAEKKLRREADGEIIKLRAAINGVKLDDSEVDALLGKKKGASAIPAPSHPKVVDLVSDTSAQHHRKEHHRKEPRSSIVKATAEFLPKIKRGFFGGEEKEDDNIVSAGWKVEVRTRKEREETLRDGVHQFEIKMKKFIHQLEEGVETVMWQVNRSAEQTAPEDEFAVKASHVTIKMQRKGDLYLQSVLNFNLRGGYLSKAIGRNRQVDKTALEPLSMGEILEVKAGCAGFDHTELPSAAGREKKSKSKSKKSKGESENRQSSLFLTVKATPTPIAHERSYIIRFKSRSARNDVLHGLRSVLADMQIQEGVSISGLQFNQQAADQDEDKIMVPLSAVNQVINKEREAYDRILLMLLQGSEDLKDKEDELLSLRSKLESVVQESAEKDRVQANDSKLIMQLSKKLETLLMDNEDLRDQNDRLNTRLVAVECEKMNLIAQSQK
ncbi:Unconventional myosin-Ic [Seminavis robusta]|uniref:Unconventional myosin-Ic n=1 Tax=Seminavis robusta TaxID=568900 RepID=A0A9N8HTZ6_9STRA|nr:Unconventional myosin-Ic [Seminavis robusta]|eukprot:Sro1732_g294170.1 Unconventional myosin-Ic (1589) ;mRNA; r:9985-15643